MALLNCVPFESFEDIKQIYKSDFNSVLTNIIIEQKKIERESMNFKWVTEYIILVFNVGKCVEYSFK